jgi:hypothetical protein
MAGMKLADEFEARAAAFREIAETLRNQADRDALLKIATDYDAEAHRLRGEDPLTPP